MEDEERQLQLFLMHADFHLAGDLAFASERTANVVLASGRLEKNLLRLALEECIEEWPPEIEPAHMIRGVHTNPIAAAWIQVMRNAKRIHQRISPNVTILKQNLHQHWWNERFAEYCDSPTLPQIQAYYAVRIRCHFAVDVSQKLTAAARTFYDQAPTDAELYLEDAENQRQNIENLVRKTKGIGMRSQLVAEFAVPPSINAYFIDVLNSSKLK